MKRFVLNDYFEQLINASLTKLIGATRKTIHDIKFLFQIFFDKGGVGAPPKKSQYRLPRFVGQKMGWFLGF